METRSERFCEALVGFQGLMLAWAFGRLNPFIKLLKNNAFKDDAGSANRVVRHGYIHAPGIQQEPLPIGSGAIESAVRRVVNLRLKGPSLFWCRASAEAILLLRSYYKAGRWNMLKHMATSPLALLEA